MSLSNDFEQNPVGVQNDTPTAVLDAPFRANLPKRQVRNLPLPPVDMTAPVTMADFEPGARFPSQRLLLRQERLWLYDNLYRGDFSYFIEDISSFRVNINYFRRVPQRVSRLAVSTLHTSELIDPATSLVLSAFKVGRGYLVNIDGKVFSPDSRQCFETQDGETLYVVTPEISDEADDGYPDTLVISAVGRSSAVTWTARWDTRQSSGREYGPIGDTISEPVETPGGWASVDRPPVEHSQWGESCYELMLSPVLEIAVRLSQRSTTLDLHEHPILWMDTPRVDAAPLMPQQQPVDAVSYGDAQVQVSKVANQDVVYGTEMDPPQYVSWDGTLDGSMGQLEFVKKELRMLSGVIVALESQGDMPSGKAMMVGNLDEFWELMPVYERAKAACELLAGECDWPPPFEPAESEQPTTDEDDMEGDDAGEPQEEAETEADGTAETPPMTDNDDDDDEGDDG